MLLSIIIPLYNCGEYIEQCILSVYKQNLDERDFEVIVVNDGSTDGGEKRVQKIAGQHNNITLINQKNQGPSATRNIGIRVAKGKYLQFLDADDYLMDDNIGRLLKIALDDDLDIITFGSKQVKGSEQESSISQVPEVVSQLKSGKEVEYNELLPSCWFYLMKRELIERLGLEFSNVPYGEDTPFTIQAFYNAARVKTTNFSAHRYRMRNSSVCHDNNPEKKLQRIRAYKEGMILRHHVNEQYRDRSTSDYEMIRESINVHLFFYLYGSLNVDIPSAELKNSISELRSEGLYPIGRFEHHGYKGLKHNMMLRLCNSEWLFLMIHKIIHAIR